MRGITTSTETALAFRNVSKVYDTFAAGSRFALRDVTFDLFVGRRVAIVGRSGSGKSTLLHLAAGIDVPTTGAVEVHGRDLATLTERERTLRRRDEIGLVFQFFYLLPHLSVWENVALPELIAGNRRQRFDPRLQHLLERVGLADRAHDSVQRLSGGEMQRVAICRALLRKPRLLLADEPTGNLDDVNAGLVMELMIQLAAEEGSTLAYVTHSDEAAALADDIWHLHSGELEIR
jgi:ABC-type lipoprotein export system ATPase subunit